MKYAVIFLSLLVVGDICCQANDFTKIDAILSEIDDAGPGVIIGVVKDQNLWYVASKGQANLDYQIPIKVTSNFRLSSTSKQFTAACIVHLVVNGQLESTDSLSTFFPEFSAKLGAVTIEQLLHHTSGIRDYMSLLMIQGARQMDFFNSFIGEDQDILALLSRQEDLAFESGTKHSYSNTNYWLLGQIVERVTGESLGTYAQKYLFEPLGMENSGFLETNGKVIPQRVAGYVSPCPDCERLEYRFQSTTVGDGGLVSSVQDLLLWEQEFHDPKLLSKAFWSQMLTTGQLNNGDSINYAAGLIVATFNGQQLIKHSGQNPGFSSQILRFPEHGLSIIVLGNQNWYDLRGYALTVAEIFFPPSPRSRITTRGLSGKGSATSLVQKDTSLEITEVERFLGHYHFVETNEFRSIVREGNELIYLRNNGPSSKLIPTSENTLVFEDRPHIQLLFTFKENGTKHIEWQDANVGNMHANSYEKAQLSDREKASFAAKYNSSELDHTVEIGWHQGRLTLSMLGEQLPLECTRSDSFSAMGMFTLSFKRSDTGVIEGFRLDAPRAENILFVKLAE